MITSIFLLISLLLSVAFVTLIERSLLRYSQRRKGPNLVGVYGLLQPFRDGIKLLTKIQPMWRNSFFISFSPLIFWFTCLSFWISITDARMVNKTSFLWLLVFRSLGGIIIFLRGWNGGSIYSVLGGIRASAQIISYEVVLSFFFLIRLCYSSKFSFKEIKIRRIFNSFFWRFFLIMPLWLISILAETNRAPFDLTEGESELVRGFNTEYSSSSFTLLFLGEYSIILAFSFISRMIFFFSLKFCFVFFGFYIMGSFLFSPKTIWFFNKPNMKRGFSYHYFFFICKYYYFDLKKKKWLKKIE